MTAVMHPESLSQLAGSGNLATVEEEWMKLFESADRQPRQLADYAPVLGEICKRGKQTQAEALAWAAIEGLLGKHSHKDVLPLAGQLLLSIGDSDGLRKQVTELYRTAYVDQEGLEELLAEAGLPGGRPVRRALRTLDVCLAAKESDFLVAREGGGAARVESLDRTSWKFEIKTPDGIESIGAVHLADRYFPATAQHFEVMRAFDPEELRRQLDEDPAPRIIEICKRHGNSIDTDVLAELLHPDAVPMDEWKKWWTKARTQLKKCANLRIEGRAPYTIFYEERGVDYEAELRFEFDRHRDPITRYELVDQYLRGCPGRAVEPDGEVIKKCYNVLSKQARAAAAAGGSRAALIAAMAQNLGEIAGEENAGEELHLVLTFAKDVAPLFAPVKQDVFLERVCKAMVEARPEQWLGELIELLPTLPHTFCDRAVEWLIEGGCGKDDLEPVIQRIVAAPVRHFGALLWLWDGPAFSELTANVPSVTILSRILRALGDSRRSDAIDKDREKEMSQAARSVLAARNYEQLDKCLSDVEPGMAIALRTQANQVENLGRTVTKLLLRKIGSKIPARQTEPAVMPWARDDILYTTEQGLSRKQDEIDHHVNVKMKENAKAIGLAAEKGDLSENSEYKFALEERDLLRARLAQMNSEVQAARVISPSDVTKDYIGIGSRAVFRNVADGSLFEMTFLGPWDADHDRGIYNYKAPLAQQLLGKRIGESVEFAHSAATGTYELIEVHDALRELGLAAASAASLQSKDSDEWPDDDQGE